GTDDVLALLYAFASSHKDIEVLLLSVTFGNVDVQDCLRNVVSMFHVIEKEMRWRKDNGRPEGFDALKGSKPVVAVGAAEPLGGERMKAAYYHGADGLGNVHASHPHHSSPKETWQHLFDRPQPNTVLSAAAIEETNDTTPSSSLFTPSSSPAHLEILRILDQEPPDTITLIGIGPLTTLATAAAHDPKVFLKAKSLIIMGGAVAFPGNMTPVAEFNTIADAVAAARVYALTSPDPESTLPPPGSAPALPTYPPKHALGDRRLAVIKFPLDITTPHSLRRDEVHGKIQPLAATGSPLAEWVLAFTDHAFGRIEALHQGHEVGDGGTWVSLHDPVCLWYAITARQTKDDDDDDDDDDDGWAVVQGEDIRVESVGQWTRGMCVVDGRDRKAGTEGEEVEGDMGGWLDPRKGNRVGRCVGTPGERVLAGVLLGTVFGGE
ncbi:MAG: hypothetical protein Q9182_004747, partial [Xanthomendoza sp. 2 TL-2023]